MASRSWRDRHQFFYELLLKDCVQQASRRLVGLNPVFCLMTTQDYLRPSGLVIAESGQICVLWQLEVIVFIQVGLERALSFRPSWLLFLRILALAVMIV